jgi:uncharacterized protein (DUF433 family)
MRGSAANTHMDTPRLNGSSIDESIFDAPSYRASEVARLLKLKPSTVRAWCFGQRYAARSGSPKMFAPIVVPADRAARLLSFANLCELHILGAITRTYGIPLQQVRPALDYDRRALGLRRPLLAEDFRTNGLGLFLEHAGLLVSVSQGGQTAMRGDFERALDRIDRGDSGNPVRLFPFTRAPVVTATQPKAVLIDPRIAFGRPVLASARVRTQVIHDRFGAGDSPAEMAGDYGVSEAEVLEALRYEQLVAA